MVKVIETVHYESEDQWLEARKRFVTATEVAQLVRRGQSYWDELRAVKAGAMEHKNISHIPAVRHGREREAAIVPYVRSLEPGLEHNEDLVVRLGKYAATPDLRGDGVVGEIKTVKDTRLERLRRANDWPTGQYYDQVQWQLFVTGAMACVFAWEPYEDWGGELVSREDMRDHITIHRDEERIKELRRVADEFLGGAGQTAPDEVQALLSQLRDVRRQKAEVAQPILDREKEILGELVELAGGSPSSWTVGGLRVRVTAPGVSRRLDQRKLFDDNPGLRKSDYFVESHVAPRVRVTEGK